MIVPAIISGILLGFAVGQYPNPNDAAVVGSFSTSTDEEADPAGTNVDRTAPLAPPRVPAIDRPSFGYRPPPPPMRREAKSAGQCSFDQKSWRFEPQTAVANAVMFDRATGLNCEECIEKCLHFQDPNSEWVCRSLTYDHRWRICDLFAVNGTSPPHFLTEYPERDYLEYLNARLPSDARLTQSSGTTYNAGPPLLKSKEVKYAASSQTKRNVETGIEPDSTLDIKDKHHKAIGKSSPKNCGENDLTRYALIFNHERRNVGSDTQLVEAKNLGECAQACDHDEKFPCLSAVLIGTECELSVSRSQHKNSDDLIFNENSTYFEKTCLPANLAKETLKLWPTTVDHILVGHVMEVVDAASLRDCQIACLQAEHQFSFICRSAMWYPNDPDQNCLLNSESRETQPNVFVAEDQGVRMLYFEVPRSRKQKKLDTGSFRDDPIEDDYTGWSLCNDSGKQYRYLKCKEKKDVRKCLKQSKNCRQATTREKSKCLAVKDSHGRKKCPHGIRKLPDGRNEYCREPVDCSQ